MNTEERNQTKTSLHCDSFIMLFLLEKRSELNAEKMLARRDVI